MILFISASPGGQRRLRTEEEWRDIRTGATLPLEPVPAARAADVRRALGRLQPRVVHFSGHGEPGVLLLHGDDDRAERVETSELVGALPQSVRLAVLNACFTADDAGAAADRAGAAIAMRGRFSDPAARAFSAALYAALTDNCPIAKAFSAACAALAPWPDEQDTPRLVLRDGHDGMRWFIQPDAKEVRRACLAVVDDVDTILMLAEDAGLPRGMDRRGGAEQVWRRVLTEAGKRGLSDALLAEVAGRYPRAFGRPPQGFWATPAPAPASLGRVAIVAVAAELGDALDRACARLRSLTGIDLVRVDAAAGSLPDAAQTVTLLGARTGGTGVLATATGRPGVVLRHARADLMAAPFEEVSILHPLHRHATTAFDTPEAAAEAAFRALHPWWEALARPPAGASPVLAPWEDAYLRARLETWRRGRDDQVSAVAGGVEVTREQVYVPLFAQADVLRTPEAPDEPTGRDGEEAPVHLERLLCAPELPHVVVEGEPGGGKTVLLQHVATVLARHHLRHPLPAHALDLDALRAGRPLAPIPILLEARALADCGGVGDLVAALVRELGNGSGHAIDAAAVRAGLDQGRYLVLIDSLDEVPTQAARDALVGHLQGWARQRNAPRLVLTTRPSAHVGNVRYEAPLRLVHLAEMRPEQAETLAMHWCSARGLDESYARTAWHDIRETGDRVGGLPLFTNPLFFTCALIVHDRDGRLPDSPAALFEALVEVLVGRRKSHLEPDRRRKLLEAVCEGLQRAGGTRQPLHEVLNDLVNDAGYRNLDEARRDLDQLYEDTGLLRFEVEGSGRDLTRWVRPWHRQTQEYLAAARIANRPESVSTVVGDLLARGWAVDPEWTGAMRLLAGVYARRGDKAGRELVTALHRAAQDHPARGRLLGLAATALHEYRDTFRGFALGADIPGEVVEAFTRDGAAWPLADRLLALEALGVLGDPRLDGDPWVRLDGGELVVGADDLDMWALPRHRVRLSPFHMLWRPVTVQDFAPFVEAGWHHLAGAEQWWRAGVGEHDGAAPADWLAQRYHRNRPVTGVSWYAATAFCCWVTDLGIWPVPAGWVIDLPTEAEWEYAATGGDGRKYPWGEAEPEDAPDVAQANWRSIARGPSPVGAFPSGIRARLADLAGNVWEWCRDGWRERESVDTVAGVVDNPCHLPTDRRAPRVVRGGSWRYHVPWLCAALSGSGTSPWPGTTTSGSAWCVVVRACMLPLTFESVPAPSPAVASRPSTAPELGASRSAAVSTLRQPQPVVILHRTRTLPLRPQLNRT